MAVARASAAGRCHLLRPRRRPVAAGDESCPRLLPKPRGTSCKACTARCGTAQPSRLGGGQDPVPELGENVAHHLGGDPVCELGSIHAPQGKRNPGLLSLPFPAPASPWPSGPPLRGRGGGGGERATRALTSTGRNARPVHLCPLRPVYFCSRQPSTYANYKVSTFDFTSTLLDAGLAVRPFDRLW